MQNTRKVGSIRRTVSLSSIDHRARIVKRRKYVKEQKERNLYNQNEQSPQLVAFKIQKRREEKKEQI
jgi:hypothetical protein